MPNKSQTLQQSEQKLWILIQSTNRKTWLEWTDKQIKYFDVNRRSYLLGWLKKMKAKIKR
jgi:hypothetical protein